MNLDHLRPEGQDPDEFRELLRDATYLYKLYQKAGHPYGRSSEALKVWYDYGQTARRY